MFYSIRRSFFCLDFIMFINYFFGILSFLYFFVHTVCVCLFKFRESNGLCDIIFLCRVFFVVPVGILSQKMNSHCFFVKKKLSFVFFNWKKHPRGRNGFFCTFTLFFVIFNPLINYFLVYFESQRSSGKDFG